MIELIIIYTFVIFRDIKIEIKIQDSFRSILLLIHKKLHLRKERARAPISISDNKERIDIESIYELNITHRVTLQTVRYLVAGAAGGGGLIYA